MTCVLGSNSAVAGNVAYSSSLYGEHRGARKYSTYDRATNGSFGYKTTRGVACCSSVDEDVHFSKRVAMTSAFLGFISPFFNEFR